jgi:hypothetical protein
MASPPTNAAAASADTILPQEDSLLIHLATVSPEALEPALANLALAFPGQPLTIAVPDIAPNLTAGNSFNTFQLLPYSPAATPATPWILTAADYLNTFKLAQERSASACLLLGPDSHTLSPESILYPVTRALFCARPRFPLALDLGLSLRMAERLATTAQRFTAANQEDALVWPVSEATIAGYTISEADIPHRSVPPPSPTDLNALLGYIAGSLFADIDTKAPFWQRMRATVPPRTLNPVPGPTEPLDVTAMLDSFHLAYANLHEIWALVLPPHTLLGLKRLSVMSQEAFRMADNLWARIVYDFILAYRLRTLNRGHLLGALTPLYLAWVASHLILVHSGVPAERHVEELALAFETDKPYLVSRWRWPDRFNP